MSKTKTKPKPAPEKGQQITVPDLSGRKVLIATPAYQGMVPLGYMNSLFQTLQAAKAANVDISYAIYANSGSIPRTRNQAVASMMGKGFTDVFFVDADMGWEPQDFLKVLSYDTPIVGAAYPARSQQNPRWIVVWPEEIKQHPTGLLTAKRAGTGFMRVRRDVFEKLEELHPEKHYYAPHTTDEDEIPHLYAFFDYWLSEGKDGKRGHLSEDYYFCDLVTEAGFTIWVDPSIHMRHYGNWTFEGKFSDQVQVKPLESGQNAE